jgi:hypothetical protein
MVEVTTERVFSNPYDQVSCMPLYLELGHSTKSCKICLEEEEGRKVGDSGGGELAEPTTQGSGRLKHQVRA